MSAPTGPHASKLGYKWTFVIRLSTFDLMLILGLVGGVASGKSFVAECFRALGAAVLDGDKRGHAVLRGPATLDAIRQRWGDGVLDASGHVNRKAVAQIVFAPGNQTEKQFLDQLTHPRIEARLRRQMDQLRASDARPAAVVIDAALL